MPCRCAREDVRSHRARADRGLPATGLAAAVFVQGGLQLLSSALVLSYQSSTAPPQGGLGVGRDRAGQRRVAGDPSINARFAWRFPQDTSTDREAGTNQPRRIPARTQRRAVLRGAVGLFICAIPSNTM
jgi:hypothetical protein